MKAEEIIICSEPTDSIPYIIILRGHRVSHASSDHVWISTSDTNEWCLSRSATTCIWPNPSRQKTYNRIKWYRLAFLFNVMYKESTGTCEIPCLVVFHFQSYRIRPDMVFLDCYWISCARPSSHCKILNYLAANPMSFKTEIVLHLHNSVKQGNELN
jgi:hypothetical protein